MNDIVIGSTIELHNQLEQYRKLSRYKFRGQSDIDWPLIPKGGRSQFSKLPDKVAFDQWKRRARLHMKVDNLSEWELLAVAQHTGLPTRLLDWSLNPLIATFFAAVDGLDKDGAVYVYDNIWHIETSECPNPFDLRFHKDKIAFYQPVASSQRIASQLGYFSVHTNPKLALDENTKAGSLERLIIPKEIKKDLIYMLHQYGINYLTIYPDLEGLGKHLAWFAENIEFWNASIPDS